MWIKLKDRCWIQIDNTDAISMLATHHDEFVPDLSQAEEMGSNGHLLGMFCESVCFGVENLNHV